MLTFIVIPLNSVVFTIVKWCMKGTSNAGMTTQHKLTHTYYGKHLRHTSAHPPSIDFIACYTPASDTLTTYEKPCQKDSFEMRLSLGRHIDR